MIIEEILRDLGYELQDRGSYYRTSALYRNGDNKTSLSIHKETGWVTDFVTAQKMPFEELIKLSASNKQEATKYLALVKNRAIFSSSRDVTKIKVDKIYSPDVLNTLIPHYTMYEEEGISKKTLEIFGVGLKQDGKLRMRYVFPIYDHLNRIIGFSGRWVHKKPNTGIPKYKNLGHKNRWVYPQHLNKQYITNTKEVILVESTNCLLHLWEANIKNVLCLFGVSCSSAIINFLITCDVERIIIATNNELDNLDKKTRKPIGEQAAQKIQKQLNNFFEKVEIHMPTKKDFGEMTLEEILQWRRIIA